jgi:hypothetical protein
VVEGYGGREAGFGEENGTRRHGDGDWVIFIAVEVK